MGNGEEFVVGGGRSDPQYGTIFLEPFFFFFHILFICLLLHFVIISYSKTSQMLLNQTDVAVDEELEMVVITVYSSTETDMGYNESGYEYSSGETTETTSEIEACLQLGLRMNTVPNVDI